MVVASFYCNLIFGSTSSQESIYRLSELFCHHLWLEWNYKECNLTNSIINTLSIIEGTIIRLNLKQSLIFELACKIEPFFFRSSIFSTLTSKYNSCVWAGCFIRVPYRWWSYAEDQMDESRIEWKRNATWPS